MQTVDPKFWYITQSIEWDKQKRKSVNVRIYLQMKVIEYNNELREWANEGGREKLLAIGNDANNSKNEY